MNFLHHPLLSITEVKYYKWDFKCSLSFLLGTYLDVFQSRIITIL